MVTGIVFSFFAATVSRVASNLGFVSLTFNTGSLTHAK